jgi:hypothetical protein
MFDFIKPEVSGMKNVIIAYDTYAQNIWGKKGGGIPHSMMSEFASWYFKQRFGPPLILNSVRSQNMIAIAEAKAHQVAAEHFNGRTTVFAVLIGMMTAENIRTDGIDFAALSPITSKCTTSNHFKVHHFGWVFFAGLSGWLAR